MPCMRPYSRDLRKFVLELKCCRSHYMEIKRSIPEACMKLVRVLLYAEPFEQKSTVYLYIGENGACFR